MKYLENSFKFFGKFFLLAIPMYIMIAVTQLLMTPALRLMEERMNEIQSSLIFSNFEYTEIFKMIYDIYMEALPTMILAMIASLVLGFLVNPATFGVINKALSTGKADLTDFLSEFLKNIGKYFLYLLGTIVLVILLTVVFVIFFGLLALLSKAIGVLGIILSILFEVAAFLALIAFVFMLSYWFPAMVTDNKGVFQGLKSSISVAKSYFWPTVGISVLIGIASWIAGMVLENFRMIPVAGPMLISIPQALAQFIMTVFFMIVYREKTGKVEEEDDSMTELPGGYL